MNSILSAISQEINHPVISELLSSVEFDFASGAVKVGLSNLKIIREYFIEENVEEHFIEALDSLIKAISGKKFDNIKTAKKTIEKIMYIIYPVEDESESDDESDEEISSDDDEEISSDDDEEISSDDESDDDSDDESDDDSDDESDDDSDDDEEMLDLFPEGKRSYEVAMEDAVDRYNDLLKNKVLKKYIVTKRFKITKDIEEDEEKREMIKSFYKVIKNIYENFSSEKDVEKMLDVLEEITEINGMI